MRISDWSSDVCSSDLVLLQDVDRVRWRQDLIEDRNRLATLLSAARAVTPERDAKLAALKELIAHKVDAPINGDNRRSEEHTSELQSLMRISYAVFCLNKKTILLRQKMYLTYSYYPPQTTY